MTDKDKEYINPETVARYEAGFNKFAKNGALPVLQIVPALEAAKEDYPEIDVFDALEIMGIKGEPITLEQFMDIIAILKDPEFIIDSFGILDTDKKGVIEEDELRSIIRKNAPNLKGREIEDIIEKPQATTNGKVNYKNFVHYWSEQ
jgi:Ca2+-binding EF-hand superfamily protein